LPELPAARQARFERDYELSAYDAGVLTAERAVADFFEATAAACGAPKLAANWIMGDLAAQLNKEEVSISAAPITPELLAGLIKRIQDNTISSKIAKQVFEAMWAGEGNADQIIEQRGLRQLSDTGALDKIIDEIVNASPDQVAQYRAADEGRRKKLLGFFVGQVMKAS